MTPAKRPGNRPCGTLGGVIGKQIRPRRLRTSFATADEMSLPIGRLNKQTTCDDNNGLVTSLLALGRSFCC